MFIHYLHNLHIIVCMVVDNVLQITGACIKYILVVLFFRLQKFKLNIANSVISQENSNLASMGTDQLLDLFSLDASEASAAVGNTDALEKPKGVKAILEGMDDLWDEQQYENEYDLSNFMKSLKK